MPRTERDTLEQRWDDVRVFLAVARERSLGQAGRKIGLDTSTVSRRLTALEHALGSRLFERTRQGLIATRMAEQMLPAAEAIEAGHARLWRATSALETVVEGTVRISMAPGMADAVIAPRLPRLRTLHPRLSIEIDASTRAIDLTRQEADLALRSLTPRGSDLVITKLLRSNWVVGASRAHVAELGRIRSWDQLDWITWDRDLQSYPPSQWLQRHARGAFIALRTSHFIAQLRAAQAGIGALLAPEPYLPLFDLQPIRYVKQLTPTTDRLPTDDLWLVGHRATRDLPRVHAVWTFLVDELRPR